MKFIIPQNYNFRPKIFGMISYSTAILNALWLIFIFTVINFFFKNIKIKIILVISLSLPLILFSIIGLNNESIFYILKYLLSYLIRPKIYLYEKSKIHLALKKSK